jgi:hypothetical protein
MSNIPNIRTRHKIYREALKSYKECPVSGLCLELDSAIRHLLLLNVERNNINIFPEIVKHRPEGKHNHEFWWNPKDEGVNKRIDVLNTAIRETNLWHRLYQKIFPVLSQLVMIIALFITIMFLGNIAAIGVDYIVTNQPPAINWSGFSYILIIFSTVSAVACFESILSLIEKMNKK